MGWKDFVSKESIVAVRPIQEFKFENRDQFMVDHDVESLAKKAGTSNQPASSATQDPNELVFLQALKQRAVSATMRLNKALSDISNNLSTIDVAEQKSRLDNAVDNLESELRNDHLENVQTLSQYRDHVQNRQNDVDRFKREHGLTREADYKTSYWESMGVIALCLIAETTLNSTLLAEASNLGLVGGMGMAIIISLINVILGFSGGLFIFPYLRHRRPLFTRISILFLLLLCTFAILFNLLIGHYREVLVSDPDSSAFLAVSHFFEGVFNLSTIQSIFLVFIGLIVVAAAFYKGSTQNDPYAGYTRVSKIRDMKLQRFKIEKEAQLDDLESKTRECEDELDEILKKAERVQQRYNSFNANFSSQQEVYRAYIEDLQQIAEIVISTYRQKNLEVRSEDSPAPKYFAKKVSIDFDQKPTIPDYPDIGNELRAEVEQFAGRIPKLKTEFKKRLEDYRNKIVAIEP